MPDFGKIRGHLVASLLFNLLPPERFLPDFAPLALRRLGGFFCARNSGISGAPADALPTGLACGFSERGAEWGDGPLDACGMRNWSVGRGRAVRALATAIAQMRALLNTSPAGAVGYYRDLFARWGNVLPVVPG